MSSEKSSPPSSELLPILGQNLPPREPPPCLVKLMRQGIPEGVRNKGMFNLLTFFRKAYPDEWKDEARRTEIALELNQRVCDPPLDLREIVSLLRSVAGTRYDYLCSQEPILSLCDRVPCERLEFGVNCKPWKEKFALVELEELNIRHLRVVNTDPPRFIVEVQNVDISLSNLEFYSPRKFMNRVEDHLSICPRVPKPAEWDKVRRDLYANDCETIEAPEDASQKGAIFSSIKDFIMQFRRARESEEILMGAPVELKGFVCFRPGDLQRFLKLHRRQFIENNELYTLLHEKGGRFEETKIRGRKVKVWMFPIDKLDILDQEAARDRYEPAHFKAKQDEM